MTPVKRKIIHRDQKLAPVNMLFDQGFKWDVIGGVRLRSSVA